MLMQADRQNLHDLKDQAQGVKHSDHHSDDEAERSATGRGLELIMLASILISLRTICNLKSTAGLL